MNFILRIFKLLLGFFLYALGVVLIINADIGYAPWDIFHKGVSLNTGLSLGMVNILTGFFLLILSIILGEKFGFGTILNMLFIGIFLDLIINIGIVPVSQRLHTGIIMIFIGNIIICLAIYLYIKSGFGAGPRDSLMVALSRKTKLTVGTSRVLIELTVTVIGYFLGGMLGIGTVICVISIGPVMQGIFKLLSFEPKDVKHENFKETIQFLMKK